jgi:hypothetical protein
MTTSVYQTKLNPEVLKKAHDDLGETEERRNQVIQIIRTWHQKQPHLAACSLGISFVNSLVNHSTFKNLFY